MFNAKQAIIINYAPGCQSSALAIDIVPHRHKTTTTTTTATATKTTTSAITRETKVYKANTCLAFIFGLECGRQRQTQLVEKDSAAVGVAIKSIKWDLKQRREKNKRCRFKVNLRATARPDCTYAAWPPHLPWQLSQQHQQQQQLQCSKWKALQANRIAST